MEQIQDYLGDGVYAKFDGVGIALHVNDHRNPMAVYLEAEVLEALNRFAKRCKNIKKENENA